MPLFAQAALILPVISGLGALRFRVKPAPSIPEMLATLDEQGAFGGDHLAGGRP